MQKLIVRAVPLAALFLSFVFVFASTRQSAAAATPASAALAGFEAVAWPAPAEPFDTTAITPAESAGA